MMAKIKSFLKMYFDETFLRYAIVGVINTIAGSAVMFLLYNLLLYPFSWGYWVSSAANHVCGILINFFLNKSFTFRNREKGFAQFARFMLVEVINYIIAYGVAKPLVYHFIGGLSQKWQDNIAMVFGMVLFAGLNYTGQRFFTFRDRKKEE